MLQEYNPKNKNIMVFVGDKLYKREDAKVSVFDSTVQNGDAYCGIIPSELYIKDEKELVPVVEAFELYMLKNFNNIEEKIKNKCTCIKCDLRW